jgi:small subunit ribosomal protein S6
MRQYETVVALSPELGEADVQKFIQDFQKILEAKGAQSIRVDSWGRRQLAFNVKKKSHASYICFYYGSEVASVVNDINAQLRINESILLFQSHRLDLAVRPVKENSRSGSGEEAVLS